MGSVITTQAVITKRSIMDIIHLNMAITIIRRNTNQAASLNPLAAVDCND